MERLILVVDTDTYSGSFERELFSYITGMARDYEGQYQTPGAKLATEIARRELGIGEDGKSPLLDMLETRQIDNGQYVYADIWPTPGFWNDGHGGHYPDDYTGPVAQPHSLRLVPDGPPNGATVKYSCEHCQNGTPHKRYPAYQSVAIFLRREPTADEIDLVKKRTLAWAAGPRPKAKILGFRLEREVTKMISEAL